MTDSQRIIFNNKLDEYFKYLKKVLDGGELNKELDSWGNKLFYRYKYCVVGKDDKSKLSQEHAENLEKRLNEVGITSDVYFKTKGRTTLIIDFLKKQNIEEKSEELEKKESINEELVEIVLDELKDDLIKAGLFEDTDNVEFSEEKIEDEASEETKEDVSEEKTEDEASEETKEDASEEKIEDEVSEETKEDASEEKIEDEALEETKEDASEEKIEDEVSEETKEDVSEEKTEDEASEETKEDASKEDFDEYKDLINEKIDSKNVHVELPKSLAELEVMQEKNDVQISFLRQKHSGRYKKFYKLSDAQYEKIGQELNDLLIIRKIIGKRIQQFEMARLLLISETPIGIIAKKTELSIEEIKTINITNRDKKLKANSSSSEIIASSKQLSKISKELKKELILKLLCKKNDVTLNDIRSMLEQKNIDTDDISSIIQELRIEVPGIVKQICEDGRRFSYSVGIDAIKQMDEYKSCSMCPIIYNMDEGTFSFIVRSDMHLNMNSSKETIQKIMYPYFNFCSLHNNMPIIDLGDLADTNKPFVLKDWENRDREALKQAYKFYKNYSQALMQASNIKHYTLFGNHEEHPYFAGLDPLEIIYAHSNNFYLLGFLDGEFRIGRDKIGVFHDKSWQNVISSKEEPDKNKRNEFIYDYLCEQMGEIAQGYIYSLIGHYHFGKINPSENFAVINNGIETSLMFTAEVKDNQVERMFVENLYSIDNTIRRSGYQIEIYNNSKKYSK